MHSQKGFTPIFIIITLTVILTSIFLLSRKLPVQKPAIIPIPTDTSEQITVTEDKTPTPTMVQQNTDQPTNKNTTSTVSLYDIPPYHGSEAPNCGNPTKKPVSGQAPLLISLQGDGKNVVGYQWDFEGDGNWDTGVLYTNPASHTYEKVGTYTPKYRVSGVNKIWSADCVYPYKVIVGAGPATLSVKAVCSAGHDNLDGHLDLIVTGSSNSSSKDYWLSISEDSSGKTTLFYQGEANFNNTYHIQVEPIRQPGSPMPLGADGRKYTLYLWQHPHTDQSPSLEKIVAQAKYQTECSYENGQIKQRDIN